MSQPIVVRFAGIRLEIDAEAWVEFPKKERWVKGDTVKRFSLNLEGNG
jgi:hypothetical protein